jgi:hypothetical protein
MVLKPWPKLVPVESTSVFWRKHLALEGVRSYRRSVVAYRNDFCVSCNVLRRALQVRSFKAYQLYSIPIIPLGFWRDWECSECGRDPHAYPGSPQNIKWMAVFLAGLFAITGVIASFDQQDSAVTVGLMRFGLPALFLVVLWFVLKNRPDRALRQKLQNVEPDTADSCALCRGTLTLGPGWRCSNCGVERKVVVAS